MLGIGKLTAGAEDYYLGLTQGIEDYYVGITSPGQWLGSSQRLLGLTGEVDPDALRAIFAGHDPSWTPLIASANRSVVAFDLTFKADKTVSLLHAFGGADIVAAVEAGQTAAIQASLRYLEDAAVHTRRGHNGVEQIHGDGLIAASFRHYQNRNEEPHLHDHVLVPNMVQGADGRWSTLDARHVYTHAKTAGYVYQAVMRHELTERLGIEYGPVHNGVAPIAGIPRTVVEAFSTRRAEILEHMERVGATSARAAQIATLQTRSAKDQEPDLHAVEAEWTQRAARLGFDPTALPQLLDKVASRSLSLNAQAAHAASMVGPSGLTEHASAFDRRDVIRSWCEAHPQGAPLSELQLLSAQTIRHEELVALHDERWTTRDLLAQEQAIINAAMKGRGGAIGVASSASLAAAIDARPTISAEQSAVARQLVEGGDGVSVLVAAAGTGKGYVLGVARDAWVADGHRVIGATLAARAAAELRDGSGIASQTITKLIGQLDEGKALKRGDVLVIDEAGMVGTRQLSRLVTHAAERNAKVVLVGDPRQLPEIDAGGVLGGLAKHVPVLTLADNRRQAHAWERAALKNFRSGSVEQALAAYDQHGRIERVVTLPDVRARIVADWSAAVASGEQAIMLAGRREDVRALNLLARAALLVGRLQGPTLSIDGVPFQVGDQVMTLRNNKRLDVHNGERGLVEHIDRRSRSMVVRMGERVVTLPPEYLEAGHVAHGYAMTVHKAQGVTVDRAFVLGTDDLYREMGYVAMSRGRNGNHLYVVGEPTREIEPLHGPSLERTAEDLLVSSLSTSRAQTMASAQINPLASVSDAAISTEYRELRVWFAAIPSDQTAAIYRTETSIRDLQGSLTAVETRRAQELSTRRSVRDVVAGRDYRGSGTEYTIANLRNRLTNEEQTLRSLRRSHGEREHRLDHQGPTRSRLDVLDTEISRRVVLRVEQLTESPTDYLTTALGERPDDERLDTWKKGVGVVERYRLERGVTDKRYALGEHEYSQWEIKHDLEQIRNEIDPPKLSRERGISMHM